MNGQKASGKTIYKRNAVFLTILILGICILFAVNSIVGIIWGNTVYPESELYNSFLPNDYINLFLGVPILVISVLLLLNQIKIGFIGWAGSLLFILYNNIAYGSMLFAALIIFLAIQPMLCNTEFVTADILVIGIMSLAFLIPCVLLARLFPSSWPKS